MTTEPFVPLEYTGPYPAKGTIRVHAEPSVWEQHDFNIKDTKSRAIGARILRSRCDVNLLPDSAKSYYPVTVDGELHLGRGLFLVDARATRGGQHFGAHFTHHYFTSETDQEVWIQKYLKEAKKRAEKNAKK